MAVHSAESFYQMLQDWGIAYTHYTHVPVFTVAEAELVSGQIAGASVKNLFVRDEKKTGLWLVTVLHDIRVDLRVLEALVGAKGRFSFCKPEVLMEHLGVTPGSVTPFAVINDTAHAVTVVLDKRIFAHELFNAHPLRNDMSTAMAPADLLTFLQHTGHTPLVVDIPVVM
ncbi:MAG: prolyl-tRNA synthetase associated domain-containing protein [Alphaproteobacteria bacterium]